MSIERWLTLPLREGIRTPELAQLIESCGRDYVRVWDSCEDPRYLVEMAAAAGLAPNQILSGVARCCSDAWGHWSGGATDARPMQIVASVNRWLKGDAGFEEIWSTWELAEQVRREVRDWHSQQQGAILANAILHSVESVHTLVTVSRNVAEPEEGHDQYDPARYQTKNEADENQGLLHDAAAAVKQAATAGAWYHSHTEPTASADDHDGYAMQILGFVLRQALSSDDVVQGLRDRAL